MLQSLILYLLLFLLRLFTLPPQSRTYTPGLTTHARGSNACRGRNNLWTRTLDRYTRVGLPECVISTMSGPPPEKTQDKTQIKDTHPIPRQKLKFLTPSVIEPGPPGWKAGTTPRRRIIFTRFAIK